MSSGSRRLLKRERRFSGAHQRQKRRSPGDGGAPSRPARPVSRPRPPRPPALGRPRANGNSRLAATTSSGARLILRSRTLLTARAGPFRWSCQSIDRCRTDGRAEPSRATEARLRVIKSLARAEAQSAACRPGSAAQSQRGASSIGGQPGARFLESALDLERGELFAGANLNSWRQKRDSPK